MLGGLRAGEGAGKNGSRAVLPCLGSGHMCFCPLPIFNSLSSVLKISAFPQLLAEA